ncbi:MAG: enoyl-CoA hydratase/isomerase family protein [Bacteroidetes bacterium]|nr:enoyl-CoA hydratase/isomerase family protein [Bacteroidota bacterium]
MSLVSYDLHDGGVLLLTVNRADKLNALNAEVFAALDEALARAAADDFVRAVVVTGAGPKAFVAGADIAEFPSLSSAQGTDLSRRGQQVFDRIERLGKPVVAAVNGFALGGGCELALACHVRVASETARFGLPEVGLGLIPGYGGTQRLPRVVGRGRALEMILSAEMVSAQRAYEIGLVNRVATPEALLADATALARTMAAKSPTALRLAIHAMLDSDAPLEDGLAREANLFGEAMGSADAKEGTTAFLEKRAPAFTGQ